MNKELKQLLEDLSAEELIDDSTVTNMYLGENEANKNRLANLGKYLNYFITNKPQIILVGEAPGYRGCCVSGIPFTSTAIIQDMSFFKGLGIEKVEFRQKEPTATIVWNSLADPKIPPLFWNAYPFHPHEKDKLRSNRRPNKEELKVGKKYLNALLKLYPDAQIIPVGKTAQRILESEGLCHPSYGGKADFTKGLKELLN